MIDDIPSPVRNSRWWYLIATVPVMQTLWVVAFGIAFALTLELAGANSIVSLDAATIVLVVLFVPMMIVTLALPVALYREITLLETHDIGRWVPDRDRIVIAAIAGILVPGVSMGVATYYLYQRHVHLGIP